jgi:hypothetical protein
MLCTTFTSSAGTSQACLQGAANILRTLLLPLFSPCTIMPGANSAASASSPGCITASPI